MFDRSLITFFSRIDCITSKAVIKFSSLYPPNTRSVHVSRYSPLVLADHEDQLQ